MAKKKIEETKMEPVENIPVVIENEFDKLKAAAIENVTGNCNNFSAGLTKKFINGDVDLNFLLNNPNTLKIVLTNYMLYVAYLKRHGYCVCGRKL